MNCAYAGQQLVTRQLNFLPTQTTLFSRIVKTNQSLKSVACIKLNIWGVHLWFRSTRQRGPDLAPESSHANLSGHVSRTDVNGPCTCA